MLPKTCSKVVRAALYLFLAMAILLPGYAVVKATDPTVTLPNPPWWINNLGTFSPYDAYQYNHGRSHLGTPYPGSGVNSSILATDSSFQGVPAIGPTPNGTPVYSYFTIDGTSSQEEEWQCTELVKRYLFLKYGVRSRGGTDGAAVVHEYATRYPNVFTELDNDGTNHVQAGDILSYSDPNNHTAIVTDTSSLDGTGTGTITILEQHASPTGTHTQSVVNWVIKHGADDVVTYKEGLEVDTVQSWLHPTVTVGGIVNVAPTTSYAEWLTAATATSSSNVIVVGYANWPGYGKRPVAYRSTDSGATWTRYNMDFVDAYKNHWLYGVTASDASNAWAVGDYATNGHYTLVEKWNGTSWTMMTSANPAPSGYTNTLYGAGLKGTTPYAVGVYWPNGSSYLPLMEYYDSVLNRFVQQSLSLDAGYSGQLYGVSFNSSTNGWAVGGAHYSTNNPYLIYRYNGTSWTQQTLDNTKPGSLSSVYAVSDDEAWAVGRNGSTPIVLHYTTDNGWQDDSVNLNGFGVGNLVGITGTSSTNLWIVGTGGVLHNFGYGWTQVVVPAGFSSTTYGGVAAISDDAWFAGYYGGTPYPIVSHYYH